MIVDYDRNNFSVSSAVFPDTNVPPKLVTILPPTQNESSHGLAKGAIIGIAVGAAAFIAFIASILYLTRRRWLPSARKNRATIYEPVETKPELDATPTEVKFTGMGTADSVNHKYNDFYSSNASTPAGTVQKTTAVEADGSRRFPLEMYDLSIMRPEVQGDSRSPVELAGRDRGLRHELAG